MKKRIALLLLTLSLFQFSACSSIYKIFNYQQYYDKAVYLMLDVCADTENLYNDLKSVWYNSIFKIDDAETDPYTKDASGRFYEDFNDAIDAFYGSADFQRQYRDIGNGIAEVEKLIDFLKNPPAKYKGSMLDSLVAFYSATKQFVALMNSSESYNSFTEKFEKYDNASVEAYHVCEFYTSHN